MNCRTFHQLNPDGATGLQIFYNWLTSPKKPIRETDISLVFNGEEYVDQEADFLAIGRTVTPLLTCENLVGKVEDLDSNQKRTVQKLLEIPTKDDFAEWLRTEEAACILEEMGFSRSSQFSDI